MRLLPKGTAQQSSTDGENPRLRAANLPLSEATTTHAYSTPCRDELRHHPPNGEGSVLEIMALRDPA